MTAIAPLTVMAPLPTIPPIAPINTAGPGAISGSDFASQLASGLGQVQQLQDSAASLGLQAASGTVIDPAQYLIATTQASLGLELTVAVRDRAVEAFNEIMRMQA